MKKIFTLCMASLIAFACLAQEKVRVSSRLSNAPILERAVTVKEPTVAMPYKGSFASTAIVLSEQEYPVGKTLYDLQTNSALANRFYRHEDGCIAATWTGGILNPGTLASSFPDRGSFYNYWNGSAWTIDPENVARIEALRTGWPTYAPYEDGEIIISHTLNDGITMHQTTRRGEGNWERTVPTVSSTANSWPRVCVKNGTIHLLEGNQPSAGHSYLYYSRSQDGGVSWNPQGVTPDLLGATYYNDFAFGGDDYIWAEPNPNNDVIAFAILSKTADLIIMKSNNNGDTWEKIIVWENPIPFMVETSTFDDTLWCPNGTGSLVIDDSGICHLAFGVGYSPTTTGYYATAGHAMYWNENLMKFIAPQNQYEALSPEDHPEYFDDGRCILAYGFDFGGDGYFDTGGEIAYYRANGPIAGVTMTQVSEDRMLIAICALDERIVLDSGGEQYIARRIYLCTYKFDDTYGDEWMFDPDWVTDRDMESYDLFSPAGTVKLENKGWYGMLKGFVHDFGECADPQILAQRAPKGCLDGNIYVFYNSDDLIGCALNDVDLCPQAGIFVENTVVMWTGTMKLGEANLPEIPLHGIGQHDVAKQELKVYPNPAANMVNIVVEENVNCIIYNMSGQAVAKQALSAGNNTIDISNMKAGVYFISAGNSNAKLVVK